MPHLPYKLTIMPPVPWIFNLNRASHGICQLASPYKSSDEIRRVDVIRGKRRFVFRGRGYPSRIYLISDRHWRGRECITTPDKANGHHPGHYLRPFQSILYPLSPLFYHLYPIAHELCIPIIRRERVSESRSAMWPSTPEVNLVVHSKYRNIVLSRTDYHTKFVRAWRRFI